MSKEMKLIMETFRSKLSEAPMIPGISPLNIGVATAAGKAEAEAAAKRQAIVKHNDKLLLKLFQIAVKEGVDYQAFVELEPKDLKGVEFNQNLADDLNKGKLGLNRDQEPYKLVFVNGKISAFRAAGTNDSPPIKIPINDLAEELANLLYSKRLSSDPDKILDDAEASMRYRTPTLTK